MAIWLAPVHEVSAKGWVDHVIVRTERRTSKGDAGSPQSCKDCVELVLRDAKAIVLLRDGLGPLIEVEGQSAVDEDRRERANGCLLGPRHTQQLREQSGCRNSVFRRNNQVVEVDGHDRFVLAAPMGARF